jgi:eukaryotic-like serine/threonine-protein kinase
MPDGRPLKPGDPARLGSYSLTARLGEGGQGVVYLGESPTGDQVAVKLLRADLAEDDVARTRFLRELEAVKRVARFCTAQVLDADVDGDRPYIVSEYVPGPSLYQLVSSESPRSGADLERLAIGTVTALVAIHQAGIVHRDFKPQNVLIGPDGPRVIDFGIARALDAAATVTNSAIGTPAYMAPEQLSGQEITPAADLFSWASTIVYAATGQAPFGQDTVMAVIHRIINESPDLGSMEEPLRGIVADCLAKDPAARPQTQALLMRLLGEEGLTPSTPGSGDPQTAIMDQGAAFAGTAAGAAAMPAAMPAAGAAAGSPPTAPRATAATDPVGATAPVGGRKPSGRAALAAIAGLLVAAVVIAGVVWATSRGGDHPSGGGGGPTPVPSSAPATSAGPDQPLQPTHRRQTGTLPPGGTRRPEPTSSAPSTPSTEGPTGPSDEPTDPGGDPSDDPGDGGGSAAPGSDGRGGATRPATNTT